MPWLILRLLGIGKWLREAATAAFRWVTASTARMLIFALCMSLAANFWLYRGKAKAIEQRDAWHLAFDKQKATYIAAQQEAEAKQKAADQSNIAGQLAAIRQQDAAHDQLEAARRDAVSEFRDAGRVRFEAACRSASGPGAADLHRDSGPPVDGQTPGDLVAVKPEQIDAWSEIELQNAERGEFLRGLVSQGLAIPQSALPEPAFGGK